MADLLSSMASTGVNALTGGLGGALGSIPGAFIQNAFNKSAEKRNYEYTRKLNEQQFGYQQELQKQQNDFNFDMWNKSNEYNSAAAQVQRYKDAGLNVGLMMGGQSTAIAPSISSANPSTPTSANASMAQAPQIEGIMSSVVNRDMTQKSLDLQKLKLDRDYELEKRRVKALEDKTTSEIDLNKVLGEKYGADKELTEEKKKETTQNIANLQKAINEMDAKIGLFNEEQNYYRALADKAKEERNWIKYNAITNRINANAHKVTAEATASLMKHQEELADSQVSMNKQQVENLVGQLQNIRKDGTLKDIQIKYQDKIYSANVSLLNGQVQSVQIHNWVAGKTKYADVADAYIKTIDDAAVTVSDCAGAVLDVGTAGGSTIFKGKGGTSAPKASNSSKSTDFDIIMD